MTKRKRNPIVTHRVYFSKKENGYVWSAIDAQGKVFESKWKYTTQGEAKRALEAYLRVRKSVKKK